VDELKRQRTGNREQGTGSREQRTENREQRIENREQRTENREQRTENREQRTENREQRTENREQQRSTSMSREKFATCRHVRTSLPSTCDLAILHQARMVLTKTPFVKLAPKN
jgi:hypothetical protein